MTIFYCSIIGAHKSGQQERPFQRHVFLDCAKITPLQNEGGGEGGMQKTMSTKALEKEAAYWNAIKKLAKLNPGMVCHK